MGNDSLKTRRTLNVKGASYDYFSLEAARQLEEEGVDVEVIDLRTLSPLDFDIIAQSVKKTGRVVVAHEACLTGGFGGEIAATIAETRDLLELSLPASCKLITRSAADLPPVSKGLPREDPAGAIKQWLGRIDQGAGFGIFVA